jgi:hypothetical protein
VGRNVDLESEFRIGLRQIVIVFIVGATLRGSFIDKFC